MHILLNSILNHWTNAKQNTFKNLDNAYLNLDKIDLK